MAQPAAMRSSIFSRRTVVRSLAAVPAIAAVNWFLPESAGAAGTVTVTRLANGGTVELIEATSQTLPVNGGGYTKPHAGNTGVRPGSNLTTVSGDITVTVDGTVIENKDIWGFVKVRAANVVIRNCIVRGSGPAGGNTGLVDCNHKNARNVLVEDCTLVPQVPSVWITGVIGKEYTARRCNVYNVVDGFGAYNVSNRSAPTNVTIESCWVHDLSYFAVDPNHANGPTHNDGVQIQGGANITIRGNNIECFMSTMAGDQNYESRNIGQGILIQPNLAPITNSDISYNWIDGGKVGLYYVLGKTGAPQATGRCEGNRFGRNQYRFGGSSTYQIRVKRGVGFANPLTNNLWEDTGAAFVESKTGGIRFDA